MLSSMSGRFYDQVQDGIIYDPRAQPTPQAQLHDQMRAYDAIHRMDMDYAEKVSGASNTKNLEWTIVPRNEGAAGLSQSDIDRFHDAAWTDVVRKRFLDSSAAGNAQTLGRDMLGVIQALNLEIRTVVIYGLNLRVEAAEVFLVQRLMSDGFLDPGWDIEATVMRLRRHPRLRYPFAMAVGAQTCCNNALMVGTGESQYSRDLQYANRDVNYREMTNSLRRMTNFELQSALEAIDATNYIKQLSHIRILKPAPQLPPSLPPPGRGSYDNSTTVVMPPPAHPGPAFAGPAPTAPPMPPDVAAKFQEIADQIDARATTIVRHIDANHRDIVDTVLPGQMDALFGKIDAKMNERFKQQDAFIVQQLQRFMANHVILLGRMTEKFRTDMKEYIDAAIKKSGDTVLGAMDTQTQNVVNGVNAILIDEHGPILTAMARIEAKIMPQEAMQGQFKEIKDSLNRKTDAINQALRQMHDQIMPIEAMQGQFNQIKFNLTTRFDAINRTLLGIQEQILPIEAMQAHITATRVGLEQNAAGISDVDEKIHLQLEELTASTNAGLQSMYRRFSEFVEISSDLQRASDEYRRISLDFMRRLLPELGNAIDRLVDGVADAM